MAVSNTAFEHARNAQEPRYIAVEGVIGVGKTTLVTKLAERLGARTVFEQFEDNPFLADFYRDREAFAFSTQIFFLMSRFRQQEVLAQGDLFSTHTLSDYFFDKDRIFAVLTLMSDEMALYQRLFDVLRLQVPQPDMIVYLRADHDVVMSRIAERGREYEADMDPEYIRGVSNAYNDYFAQYTECPVLTIDTSQLDLRTDVETLDRIEMAVRSRATQIAGLEPPRGIAEPANLTLPGL